MNIKKLVVGIVVLVVLVAVVVFGGKSASPDYLTIGVISVLSGDRAVYGENFKKGIELAKDEYLTAHPDSTIDLVFADDAYDGQKGLEAFKKMRAEGKVDALIVATTPTINALYAEVKKAGLPVLSYGAQTAPEEVDNVFHLFPDPIFSDIALGTVMKNLNASTTESVVAVYTNNDAFVNFYGAFQQAIGADINEFNLNSSMTSETAELRAVASQVAAKNPKYIFMTNYPELGAKFIKEYKTLTKGKLQPTFVFDMTFNPALSDYATVLGDLKVLDGSLVVVPEKVDQNDFVSRFEKKYGEKPGELADYGYDAFGVVVNSAASSAADWVKNMGTLKLKGATGSIQFDEGGRRIPAFSVGEFKGGVIPSGN